MSELRYTSVDRIIAKLHREIQISDISESNIIEWIGEALEFLQVTEIQEQSIAFLEVKNHHAEVPTGFQMVIQIARNNHWVKEESCPSNILEDIQVDCESCKENVITDCNGTIIKQEEYVSNFDITLNYQSWVNTKYYQRKYTPVRLSNHTLYNSIVCREKIDECIGCTDEYTIVGTIEKRIRTSFKEGYIAMAYLRNAMDKETGYPLVPDEIGYITAISYYVKWKISEWYQWSGREGSGQLTQDFERKWLKYCNQAMTTAMLPKSLDEYQNLLEQTHYLIPNHKKYYGFFGNLGRSQQIGFKNGR